MIDYPKYKKVLLCTDFSDNSYRAFEYAFGIAKRDDGVLYLLHIIPDVLDQNYPEFISSMKRENIFQAKEALQKSSEKQLDNLYLNKIKNKDNAKCIIKTGREDNEILKYAAEEKIDIIVIGTHGKTGLKHLLLGSVAEKIIRQSSIPVLVIPSKEKLTHTR